MNKKDVFVKNAALILCMSLVFMLMSCSRNDNGNQQEEKKFFELIQAKKIWDYAPHNAFTDLIRFKDMWYMSFREADGHVSNEGKLRILRSVDGTNWESATILSWPETSVKGDMREGKFSVTPDGLLMVNAAVAFRESGSIKGTMYSGFSRLLAPDEVSWEEYASGFDDIENIQHQTLSWLTADGDNWQGPYVDVKGAATWIWSVKWHDGTGYGVGYTGKDESGTLYATKDGKGWNVVINDFFPEGAGYCNETSIVFDHDEKTAYCLMRRDPMPYSNDPRAPDSSAMIGMSQYPFTQWDWIDLEMRLGGPKLYRLPTGRFIAAFRYLKDEYAKHLTVLAEVDMENGKLINILELPSGGDTSYAGIVWHDNELWVSYYSSHEANKSSIYLARVRINN